MSWHLRRKLSIAAIWCLAIAPWLWEASVALRIVWLQRESHALRDDLTTAEREFETERLEAPRVSPLDQRTELSKWRLPDGPDLAGTMQRLEQMAIDAGVDIRSLHSPSPAQGGLQRFEADGVSEPEHLCRWLASLENLAQLTLVQAGRVFRTARGVGFELKITSYFEAAK